jgi:hypothetical protein
VFIWLGRPLENRTARAGVCSQQGANVVCERYGGFFYSAGLPSNCEIGTRMICFKVHICTLITYIYIVNTDNPGSMPPGTEDCWNYDTVAGRTILK